MHGMDSTTLESTAETGEFRFFDRKPPQTDATRELMQGLTAERKYVSAKYFYDQRGSELFEAITRLPEYYLTRTEMGLFDTHAEDLARAIGEDVCLVEYGSGSSAKIRKLLPDVAPRAYVPVDISREHLEDTARALHADFSHMDVYPTCADITRPFELPEPVSAMAKVGFFPGSSIGNFDPGHAAEFLSSVAGTLGDGSRLLIGVDRKKDPATLEAAYNDSAGVTAEFNLNMLRNLSRLLGCAFDEDSFAHRAHYDDALGCIQMYLTVTRAHDMEINGEAVQFALDEEVHTENSFKYHPEEFLEVAEEGGYRALEMWTDPREWFALYLLEAA